MNETFIHPTAIVEPGAELGIGTTVDAYSIIRSTVRIGSRCKIGPHVVIEGHTTMGDENQIFQFASVGSQPQDLKFKGEPSRLEFGDRNIIREFATIQPGTQGGGMLTKIGSQNLFMVNSHIGHDGKVGDRNIFANSCALAGHVTVGNGAILGGLSAIHQFVHIGDLCMIAGGAMVAQDVPPYCMVHGNRAEVIGLNEIGLKRAGISVDEIKQLKKLYRQFFYSSDPMSVRLQALESFAGTSQVAKFFIAFIRNSERGVVRSRRSKHKKADQSNDE